MGTQPTQLWGEKLKGEDDAKLLKTLRSSKIEHPTVPVCLGLGAFSGCTLLSAPVRKVLGQPGQVGHSSQKCLS